MTKHDPADPATASPEALRQQGQAAGRRFDPALGRRIALAYDELQVTNLATTDVWGTLAHEEYLLFLRCSREVSIEPWLDNGQPYASSQGMRHDVLQARHLYVFMGGDKHPARTRQVTYRGRAVHDICAHAIPGHDFSPDGELRAFVAQARLTSVAALPALATDNLGPTAWYYFHPSNEGKPHSKRRWPVQKADLLPRELWEGLLA